VKLAVRTAAGAGGLLTVLFIAGCGTSAGQTLASGVRPATVPGCTAYGVHAIEHHVTVTQIPPACQGLSRAEINQAAGSAVRQVTGGGPKAESRRRVAAVAPFLDQLITASPTGGSSPGRPGSLGRPGSGAAASPGAGASPGAAGAGPLGGRDLVMDVAALIAWLVTAASGAYVLGRWISGGGTLRSRSRPRLRLRARVRVRVRARAGAAIGEAGTGSPPIVILGHFGLALAGLVIWVTYLAVGWAALAWAAVGVLLPVAGLGMAALVIGLPGRVFAPADRRAPVLAGHLAPTTPTRPADGRQAAAAGGAPAVTGRWSPLVVVGHGLLAVTTMVLVLLAALGTAAR
jgi:hypothetical protein